MRVRKKKWFVNIMLKRILSEMNKSDEIWNPLQSRASPQLAGR